MIHIDSFLVDVQLQFTDPDCFDLVAKCSTTVDTTERIVLTTTTTRDNKYFYIYDGDVILNYLKIYYPFVFSKP